MNDYIVTYSPMGGVHLEHRSHKYITRKWKNGRWVYTYPTYSGNDKYKRLSNIKDYSRYAHEEQMGGEMHKKVAESPYNAYIEKMSDDEIQKEGLIRPSVLKRMSEQQLYDAQQYREKAMQERSKLHQEEAKYARETHQAIKKWESTPLSKIQTYAHKAVDAISNWLKKHK